MKLPNSNQTTVEREKIVDYPDNGGKASFFIALGFSLEAWRTMVNAFRELAHDAEVTLVIESSHGIKYIVDGRLSYSKGQKSNGANGLDSRPRKRERTSSDRLSV